MKKKMVLVFFIIIGINVFAQNNRFFSVGIGGQFLSGFGGGYDHSYDLPSPYVGKGRDKEKWPYNTGGVYGFFDARFAELNFGFFTGTQHFNIEGENVGGTWKYTIKDKMTGLNFALLGKYPFTLGKKITIFPLLGIEYMYILSIEDNYVYTGPQSLYKSFNQFWFKTGGGVDFSLTDRWFLRMETFYGIRLDTKAEKKRTASNGETPKLGHGLTVRAGVGFRL